MTATSAPRVLVSILHWGDAQSTLACIASVQAGDYADLKIVVTDNASALPLPEDFAARFPTVELIRRSENTGFAGGHNAILRDPRYGDFDYFWLLNNDCLVAPDCLSTLLTAAGTVDSLGLLSPVVRYQEDHSRIEFAVAIFDWRQFKSVRLRDWDEIARRYRETPQDVWLTGTALLIPRAVLQRLEYPLDERLFAYYEDNDISLRVARLGLHNRVVREASVFHSAPSDNATRGAHYHYLMARNEYLFWRRHLPRGSTLAFFLSYLASSIEGAAQLAAHRDKRDARLIGAWDGLCGHTGAPRPRAFPSLPAALLSRSGYRLPRLLRRLARVFLPSTPQRAP